MDYHPSRQDGRSLPVAASFDEFGGVGWRTGSTPDGLVLRVAVPGHRILTQRANHVITRQLSEGDLDRGRAPDLKSITGDAASSIPPPARCGAAIDGVLADQKSQGPTRAPGSSPAIPGPAMISDLAVEQGAGHNEALDLVGSLVDLGDLIPGPG
ncbi:MAG TPA: hypothetical protein VHY21_22475 [Pseudonocardiaceae bacterium]|jgi:hypothetical protein|nr:hypothetical protein [Pseudonocardiaceae bacterium]